MENSSFLSEFMLITNFKTILFIGILILVFVMMKVMEKKKIKFSLRMITATVSGLILGVIIQAAAGFPEVPKDIV